MKKLKLALLTSLIMFALVASTLTDEQKHDTLVEGQSVGQIRLGMSVSQVDSILKSKPEKIVWKKYSYEYRYEKEGIGIWEKQEDSTHSVFAITVNPKRWKGKTSKGLRINRKLITKDIIEVYGKPEWLYTSDCTELDAEYENFGIYFSVEPMVGICDETSINHDSLFINSRITELTIGEIGTDY